MGKDSAFGGEVQPLPPRSLVEKELQENSHFSLCLLPPSHFLPVLPIQLDPRAQGSPVDAVYKMSVSWTRGWMERVENGSDKAGGNYLAKDACFER